MKDQDWSRLEGKKILLIGTHGKQSIRIGKIVGCDPDIGICIADVDKIDPWFIVPGPKSPYMNKLPEWETLSRSKELESIYRQLQSGYYSKYEDDLNEIKIYGNIEKQVLSLNCPFTM